MPAQSISSHHPSTAIQWPPDLIELMAELAGIVDATGRLTYVNRAWKQALGYTRTEALQIHTKDLVAYEDRGRHWAAILRLMSGENVVDFEAVLMTKSGARIVCRGTASPHMVDGAEGTRVYDGAFIICTDVTAQRRAEVTRARLATTLDVSPDFVGMMTADKRVTYLNRAGRQMLGIPEDVDLSTLSPADAHPPKEWEQVQAEAIPIAIRDGVWRGETVLTTASGERIPVSQVIVAHPSFRPDEPPYFISTVMRDLSERVRAEAVVRESERRFRSVLENVRAIAITLDCAGNLVFANDYLLELTGWKRDEVLETNWFDRFIPEAEASKALFQTNMRSEETSLRTERAIRTRSGEERLIEWDHTLLRDVDGRVTGMASLGHDVTTRRRAERLKNELIGIVSHELRSPIGAVHGALDLLQNQLTLTGRPAEFLAMARRNTDRALLLVKDLLNLEQLESGTLPMERHPVSVTELFAMAHEGTQLAAQSAAVSITVEVASEISETKVSVDAARMQQVLVNLITNAIKFSPTGSTISLSADAPGDGTMHIMVRDQGRGIPVDMIGHVFDRFVQIRHDDAKERGGAGLGLPIAKAIVEQHGGRIWAESELGHGSVFHLTLPIDIS